MSWQFKNYVSARGDNEIRLWLESLPNKKARFKIDARIKYLQQVDQLKFPYVEKLVGEEDLYEVRVVFGVQYRIIGCYGIEKGEFILLIGAIEKDWKLEPKNAIPIARSRKHLISNRSYICDHFEED